jgi:hypothetical protein
MSSCDLCGRRGARWPRFGLVVVATYSRRDNKDQMIGPLYFRQNWNFPEMPFFTKSALEFIAGREQVVSNGSNNHFVVVLFDDD